MSKNQPYDNGLLTITALFSISNHKFSDIRYAIVILCSLYRITVGSFSITTNRLTIHKQINCTAMVC